MGVYIKNMEMPFTCLTCDFHKCAGGVGDFCSLTKRRQFRFKNRPKDCPLIEIPESHGRLGDLDQLKELFRELIGNIVKRKEIEPVLEHMVRASAMVIEMIDDAPVIIEAEEGE